MWKKHNNSINRTILRCKWGEILIDGKNIKEYNLYELRKKIGLVLQEPSIFKRNIYENILYGKLDSNNKSILSIYQKSKTSTYINR